MSISVSHYPDDMFVGLYKNRHVSDAISYSLSLAAISVNDDSEVNPAQQPSISMTVNGADSPAYITYVIVNGLEVESIIVSIADRRDGVDATYYAMLDHAPDDSWHVVPNIVIERDDGNEDLFVNLPIQDQLGYFLS